MADQSITDRKKNIVKKRNFKKKKLSNMQVQVNRKFNMISNKNNKGGLCSKLSHY